MADTTITERDAVKREREAFKNGAAWGLGVVPRDARNWTEEANRRYPLPKVTRPRVVRDPQFDAFEWSVVDGNVAFRRDDWGLAGTAWSSKPAVLTARGHMVTEVTRARAALWAELLANPTETIEDDS